MMRVCLCEHRAASQLQKHKIHRSRPAELFFQSPLCQDHRARAEVVSAYLDFAESENDANSWASIAMAGMSFYTTLEQQWGMILELIDNSPDRDDVLQAIAAGALEGCLGRSGSGVIAAVESHSASASKFARVPSGVWQRVREMKPFE